MFKSCELNSFLSGHSKERPDIGYITELEGCLVGIFLPFFFFLNGTRDTIYTT